MCLCGKNLIYCFLCAYVVRKDVVVVLQKWLNLAGSVICTFLKPALCNGQAYH